MKNSLLKIKSAKATKYCELKNLFSHKLKQKQQDNNYKLKSMCVVVAMLCIHKNEFVRKK